MALAETKLLMMGTCLCLWLLRGRLMPAEVFLFVLRNDV